MSERTDYLHRFPDGTIYFRYQRRSLGRLPLPEGSDEFNAEYDRLLKSVGKRRRKMGRPAKLVKPRTVKGSIGLFVERWRASDFFADAGKPKLTETPYAEGTQINYRLGLDLMHALGMTAMSFSERPPTAPSNTSRG